MEGLLAVDTSVAVPLLVATHEAHRAVRSWGSKKVLHLSGHALAETYSVLTRLPGDARVSPQDAVELIDDNFEGTLTFSPESTLSLHRKLAAHHVVGGAVYDGMVALAAQYNDAVLVTRDARARATYEVLGVPTELVIGV